MSITTTMVELQCPVPECTFATPDDSSENLACTLQTAHTYGVHMQQQHAPATGGYPVCGPKLERPKVDMGVGKEEWNMFTRRWDTFVTGCGLDLRWSFGWSRNLHCLHYPLEKILCLNSVCAVGVWINDTWANIPLISGIFDFSSFSVFAPGWAVALNTHLMGLGVECAPAIFREILKDFYQFSESHNEYLYQRCLQQAHPWWFRQCSQRCCCRSTWDGNCMFQLWLKLVPQRSEKAHYGLASSASTQLV